MSDMQSVAADAVCELSHSAETEAFVFVARKQNTGEVFSMPMVTDDSGTQEVELLAEYVAVVADRTDRERESVLRELIGILNDIPCRETAASDGGGRDE